MATFHAGFRFKAYTGQRPGGIGFGNQSGEGPQVDLLMLSDELPASPDSLVRWCFADLTLQRGQSRYSLLTCIEVKRAAMGTIGHGRQNNFRVKDVFAGSMNWLTLLDKLEEFVLGQISPGTQHVASRVF
jgi:hypothetical protein